MKYGHWPKHIKVPLNGQRTLNFWPDIRQKFDECFFYGLLNYVKFGCFTCTLQLVWSLIRYDSESLCVTRVYLNTGYSRMCTNIHILRAHSSYKFIQKYILTFGFRDNMPEGPHLTLCHCVFIQNDVYFGLWKYTQLQILTCLARLIYEFHDFLCNKKIVLY